MKTTSPERLVPEIFASADVAVNGSRPWDIQVHHHLFYKRLAAGGSMALGESYMDGWWDCEALDQFFARILRLRLDHQAKKSLKILWCAVKAACTSSPGRFRAFAIGRRHYDIGNDLFSLMLDKWMNYSCAYWKDAGDLDEAQESKMDLICRKLQLQPGMRILDVGCGWGGLAAYAAKHYDVEVLGITVSREQIKLARQRCEGLPVTIKLEDFRRMKGTFDRIVSVGMFEHVGGRSLSHLHAHDPPLPKTRGAFSAAHHRWQPISAFLRPLDFQIHLPKLHAAIQPTDFIGSRKNFWYWKTGTASVLTTIPRCWLGTKILRRTGTTSRMLMTDVFSACGHTTCWPAPGPSAPARNQVWQIVFSNNGVRSGYEGVR